MTRLCSALVVVLPLVLLAGSGRTAEPSWIELTQGEDALKSWQNVADSWQVAGDVALEGEKGRTLTAKSGKGVLAPKSGGRARNLVSREKFADAEVHVEFLIARGSNAGVKLMGLYEIQILDTHSAKELTGNSCGGIYPRAEARPRYHHIDDGVPPRVNAARPAGEWQTLDIVFRAPRFDEKGQKTANARFVKAILNGKTIHEDVEVSCPTGAAWRLSKEVAQGPLLLQGDHGPVAFRNVRIRSLEPKK